MPRGFSTGAKIRAFAAHAAGRQRCTTADPPASRCCCSFGAMLGRPALHHRIALLPAGVCQHHPEGIFHLLVGGIRLARHAAASAPASHRFRTDPSPALRSSARPAVRRPATSARPPQTAACPGSSAERPSGRTNTTRCFFSWVSPTIALVTCCSPAKRGFTVASVHTASDPPAPATPC